MKLQPGKQTIAIQVLSNISKGKGNHTMKFGQLVKNDRRKIFLKKSYTKCGEETILRLFSKN